MTVPGDCGFPGSFPRLALPRTSSLASVKSVLVPISPYRCTTSRTPSLRPFVHIPTWVPHPNDVFVSVVRVGYLEPHPACLTEADAPPTGVPHPNDVFV